MDYRMDVQNLFELIKFISEEAAHILREAVPYDPDILTLTKEDLNKLLPGEQNFQVRRHIMGLIDVFLQVFPTVKEQDRQSMDSSPADVMKADPNGSDILTSARDAELQPGAHVDQVQRHIIGLINVFLQMQAGQNMDSSPADVMKADPNGLDIPTLAMEDLNKFLPGERNFQVRRHIMGLIDVFLQQEKQVRQSMNSSSDDVMVKVHILVVGETFGTQETFIQNLKLQIERDCSEESSNVILVFCPVVSRIGTDMEAAMAGVTEDKPVILVFMHDNPIHMTNITVQPSRSNIVQVVHCAFHQYKGLLECQENEQAVKAVRSALLRYVDLHDKVSHTESDQQMAAQGNNRAKIMNDNEIPGMGTDPVREENESVLKRIASAKGRSTVKVHVLVAGETFKTYDTFIQKLNLQIELCSAESSNVILVFCPVVSHIRTDMDAAMAGVTDNKPVILVFMHHCHNPSHMTDITEQPSRSNIVQVVHCAFHETKGLLECQENEQAVKAVRSALLRLCRCVDVQAEVSLTQSKIEQQPVAAQNANRPIMTNEVPRTGTKPMTGKRESDQRKIAPAEGHSTAPSGGTSLLSKTERFFSKSNWNISSVKVHMVVSGETFQAHDTFIQKLKLQIELCSAESSSIILVFCPVVSQIGTDMEAAMSRVTGNKPVILVFMHHCHNPSHMTDITVQPSRSNIVQVVHCAFHETIGLLQCQENEQAVDVVRSTLLRYK